MCVTVMLTMVVIWRWCAWRVLQCMQYDKQAVAGSFCTDLCHLDTIHLSSCTLHWHGFRVMTSDGIWQTEYIGLYSIHTKNEIQDFLMDWHSVCIGPLPCARQHPSCGDCLLVKREYYQNCSVLDCVTQCSQSAAHLYEQFLQVQQIGFVTLGPLRCA